MRKTLRDPLLCGRVQVRECSFRRLYFDFMNLECFGYISRSHVPHGADVLVASGFEISAQVSSVLI